MTEISLRPMTLEDYDAVLALWRQTPGIGLGTSDEREAIGRFLLRNPGMSVVAVSKDAGIVGAVMAGHDGRRGYLHHLAVKTEFSRRGIGQALVTHCLEHLAREGIERCNIFLFATNHQGRAFWQNRGWVSRGDLEVLQYPLTGCFNQGDC